MAIIYTDTGNEQNISFGEAGKLVKDGARVSGDRLLATAVYTVTGAEAPGDVINIIFLPKSVRIVPEESHASSDGVGTVFSFTVGDADVTDRYSALLNIAAAGTSRFGGGTDVTAPAKTTKEDWVIATLAVLTGLTPGSKISFSIAYVAIS